MQQAGTCGSCGRTLWEATPFCGGCGAPLPPAGATAEANSRPQAPTKRRAVLVASVAGALVVALGIAGVGVAVALGTSAGRSAAAQAGAAPTAAPTTSTRPAPTTTAPAPPFDPGMAVPTVGTCMDDDGPTEDSDLVDVPCSAPHRYELAGAVPLEHAPGAPYPGDAAFMSDSYDSPCTDALYEDYLGADVWARDDLGSYEAYPGEEEWDAGEAVSLCLVEKVDESRFTGSLGGQPA